MKTLTGIVFSVIGLGLDLWDVYVYEPRLAISILLFLSRFSVISTILIDEHRTISHSDQN